MQGLLFNVRNHFRRNLHFMQEKKFLQSVNSRAMLNPQCGGGVRKYLLTSIPCFYWFSGILTQKNKNFLFWHKKSTFKVARTCKNSLKTILFLFPFVCVHAVFNTFSVSNTLWTFAQYKGESEYYI